MTPQRAWMESQNRKGLCASCNEPLYTKRLCQYHAKQLSNRVMKAQRKRKELANEQK